VIDLEFVAVVKDSGPIELNPFAGANRAVLIMNDSSVFICNLDYFMVAQLFTLYKNGKQKYIYINEN
jgi:hypothetical protein